MTSSGWNEPYSDNQNPGTENFGLYDLPNVIVNTGNTSIEWESSAMYFNAHTINIAPGYYGGLGAVSVEVPDDGTYLINATFLMLEHWCTDAPTSEGCVYVGDNSV